MKWFEFQIFARIFSLGIFFFTARNFLPTVPILLLIHFIIVFLLKWTFERARHTQGKMALLVAVLNVFASSLVYVRIVPIDKTVKFAKNRKKAWQKYEHEHRQMPQQHSTFFIQTLFFALVFVENVTLASWPLIKGPPNRALSCLGQANIIKYLLIISGLCAASWICHILYYKYMGHPWTEINGPHFTKNGLKFNLHLCGEEHYLWCHCCPSGRSDNKFFRVYKCDHHDDFKDCFEADEKDQNSEDPMTNIELEQKNGFVTSNVIDV